MITDYARLGELVEYTILINFLIFKVIQQKVKRLKNGTQNVEVNVPQNVHKLDMN